MRLKVHNTAEYPLEPLCRPYNNQALLAWNRFLQTVSQHPFCLKGDNFYISMKGVLTPLNREVETIDALVAKLEVCIRENSSSEEPLFLYLEN